MRYEDDVSGLRPEDLADFFVDWPLAPSPEQRLAILRGSDRVLLAREPDSGRVVGFVTAITDGVLSAYIPLLEVLPEYQGAGIGTELLRRLLDELSDLYMVDLVCDPELEGFYRRFGMIPLTGMALRNRAALMPLPVAR
ncbi:MAG: GNAT family N-acetyltransferase [Actinobacteria bacterium]|nr:GNAT family N-acetyltransferase [Actinomycetota bacterium]